MTVQEFSAGFDTLLNSYSQRGSFGDTHPDIRLDEYEKSLFLTRAQEDIILGYYTGKNPYNEGFEETEEVRKYLDSLIVEAEEFPYTSEDSTPIGISKSSSIVSTFFKLPPDVWFITYERVKTSGEEGTCANGAELAVYPTRQDEYHKIKKNPFRGPNSRRALRLDLAGGIVEIVSKNPVSSYYLRYLKKLSPIILVNLENEGLKIDNETKVTECQVHESLHRRILERAVLMALQSRGGSVQQSER